MANTQKLLTGRSSQFVDSSSLVGFVDGIIEGTVLAGAGAMQVSSSGLSVIRNNALEVVPNTTLNVSAADATDPRIDMVQWDGATLTLVTGTPALISTLACPAPTVGNIPLCLIFIYPVGTTIKDLGYQDSSGQFNAIFAYYYARRGLYAALLARGDSLVSGSAVDPVVALPIYNARVALYRIEFSGGVTIPDSTTDKVGIQVVLRLDGTSITRTDDAQRLRVPTQTLDQTGFAISMQYSRSQVSAGSHRWNPFITVLQPSSTLTYRQMELQEIL
ncbi:hypothetical protein MUP77_13865 [Candidatus Bathyarchaeota archaeon]|nr:hypothetical protein [Candidatus Bathyarchaeota archaeon]